MLLPLIAAVVSAIQPSSLVRTNQLTAVSPSGKLTLRVVTPVDVRPLSGGGWVPASRTLTESATGRVLWTRTERATRHKGNPTARSSEPAPVEVFVADDGATLGLYEDGSFAGLQHPFADARRTHPLRGLFADPCATEQGGAGWRRSPLRIVFLTIPFDQEGGHSRTCLAVRAWWDEHLVFDAHSCELLARDRQPATTATPAVTLSPAMASRVLEHVLNDESEWVLSNLAAAAQKLPALSEPTRKRDLETALSIVGPLKLRGAVPALRQIENAAAS